MTPAGFPHSEILESKLVCQLLEAYRRLQRPSSAPTAKASTMCSYKLDTQKSKMLASTVQFSRYGRAHLLPAPASLREVVHPDPMVRPVDHHSIDLR